MQLKSGGLAAAALAGLILGGCQSSRISGIDTGGPAPVTAAPAGTIQQSQLPAPTSPAPVVATAPTDPSQFPSAPTTPGTPAAGTQVAAASGPDVTVGSVAGVWSVSTGGGACKVKSWNVAGKQLVFYDESGGKVATLYQSSPGKFDGQTTGGSAVSLTR